MTRELRNYAKNRIEYLIKISPFVFDERDREALEIAIQALSQETCEDAISRKNIGLTDFEIVMCNGDYKQALEMLIEKIQKAPSVTPKSETVTWIPVSEELPKENEAVIVSTKYGVYPEAKYTKEYGWEWAYEAGADYWKELKGVTAWMPLPKPYEPQESEDKE